jgi:hypothetical protein
MVEGNMEYIQYIPLYIAAFGGFLVGHVMGGS